MSVHPTGLFKTTKTADDFWVLWHKALDGEEKEWKRKYGFQLEEEEKDPVKIEDFWTAGEKGKTN